jgi:pyruvate/2-oxoglutarate dehydrogenase complex dihydrolipoamide dehydrogenase (E3) component
VTAHFQFTHMADYEAQIVIQNAFVPFPFKKKTDFRVVPWATFTEPEVGRVGLIEAEAREKFGTAVKVYQVNFTDNDRAQAESQTEGFAKIVTNKGRIVGATLVGEHAGELIHEFVWAMRENLKISELNRIIRVYPTLGENHTGNRHGSDAGNIEIAAGAKMVQALPARLALINFLGTQDAG